MPKRIGLPLEAWPLADRAAWQRATATEDFFADDAGAAHWRPKTQQQARYAYARWLTYLRDCWPDALEDDLAERVTPDRIQNYVDKLATRQVSMSVAAELQHLRLALGVLAPRVDWAWLKILQRHWQQRARPRDVRHKIVDPRRLLNLGCALMDSADACASPSLRARQFRDGLLIAVLVALPLRRRSLTALRLDEHVRRVGDTFQFVLDADDTKAGHAVDVDIPQHLAGYFLRYLTQYRPLFPRADQEGALWLSSKGGALGAEAIYDLVCRRTQSAFGFAIHPHLFRTIAATTIAREDPENIAMARDLLTHSKLNTTMDYYAKAQTVVAARRHTELLAELRAKKN